MESNYSSDEDNCVAAVSSTDSSTLVDAINLPVIFGKTSTNVLVNSGSVCTIINESLANSIISHDLKSKWIREANPKQLKTFSNEPINTVGILQTSIQSSNWYANPIEIQVVADGHRSLLGRDLFPALGLSIHQSSNNVTINQVDQEYCPIKKQIAIDYPDLISRIDADTVPVAKYLDDAGWVNPERSDLEIETAMNKEQQDSGLRYRDSDDKESRFIIHPKLSNPIPRTEKSLSVKLARKITNKKRAKRQLAGLYEVLKPGSFVTKSSPTTTIINEPGRMPVKVRDSDLAMFGTKAERSTNLWTYAQRRPAPYEQTTEIKIAKHNNDIKKQKRGEIKIRHRHRDTTSVVSSVNSNVSRALTVRKPTKPQPKRRRNAAPINDNDNATVQEQQLISIVPAPQTSSSQNQQSQDAHPEPQKQQGTRKRNRPQFYGFTDADISPTSSLTSTSSGNRKNVNRRKRSKRQQPQIQ